MRAAVLEAAHRLVVRPAPAPQPRDGEVVLAVKLAGICGSDVALFEGTRSATHPLILGHEAIGRIVEPGSSGLASGTYAVVEPNIPCGICAVCRRGWGSVCPSKRALGLNAPGVFADAVAVPAGFVHALPPAIEPLDAVGIEPLAVAVRAVWVGNVQAAERVAVIGCGPVGLLVVQVAVAMGAQVLAADARTERLALAERVGAAQTVHVGADESTEHLGGRIAATWTPTLVYECAPCPHASGTFRCAGVGSPCCIGRLSDFASSIVRCRLPTYPSRRRGVAHIWPRPDVRPGHGPLNGSSRANVANTRGNSNRIRNLSHFTGNRLRCHIG